MGLPASRVMFCRHTPRKRGIQYAAASLSITGVSGILDHPPARVMTGVFAANNERNKSAKPRWPLERSIPEFPTKVGGHHMTGSTDPARDSSLKDR
jgi:hypothetical protein